MIDYQNIYTDFYCNYYDKTEVLVKHYFEKCKSKNRAFGVSSNEINHYLNFSFIEKYPFFKNENFVKLYRLFSNRHSYYEANSIQEIFENEIKTEFDRIDLSNLPTNYNYIKLIKDIAIIDVANEISRLLSNNNRLFNMMYDLNNFADFEIREYRGLSLEDYPVYKKLHILKYPEYYTDTTEINALGATQETNKENIILSLFKNADVYHCFLEYQKYILDFYTDYSYLKKRLEKEKLIHKHKDNEFIEIVYSDLKLISEKKITINIP